MLPTTFGHAMKANGYTRSLWLHHPDETHPARYRITGPFDPDVAYVGTTETFRARWGVDTSVVAGNLVGERASLDGLQEAIELGKVPGLPPDYVVTMADVDDAKVLTRNGQTPAYDDLCKPAVVVKPPVVVPPVVVPPPPVTPPVVEPPVVVVPPPVVPPLPPSDDPFERYPELKALNASDLFQPRRGGWFLAGQNAEHFPFCRYVEWVVQQAEAGVAAQITTLAIWRDAARIRIGQG